MSEKEKLITENLGLVRMCVQKFMGRGIEYDDLFQIGCIGLIKAAEGFDKERGIMFSTYAVPTILGEIKRVFRDTGAIKVSRSLKEMSFKVIKCKEELEKQTGREPTISEIAEKIGITPEEVSEAICVTLPVVSLTVSNEDGTRQLELPTESKEEEISNKLYLEEMLSKLDETQRKLIDLRYFKYKTQSETAIIMNMSQVQISRLEKKILRTLRVFEEQKIKNFKKTVDKGSIM